jgi:DNA-binding FadR family transcriptional regulator
MFSSKPFGSESRTRVLISLELLGESYPRELARLLGCSLSQIQNAVTALERDGLVAVRSVGRTRLVTFNPRYFARRELQSYLRRLSEADPELQSATAALRRRPRRTGKDL